MSDMSPVEVIYFAALEKLPAERAAYLDEACAGDAALRARVDGMLAAQPKLGQFIEPPQAPQPATGAYCSQQTETPGTIIAGKYKLLQRIGEGGMGSVWMADQTEPVKRRVAVKLIRSEREGSQTIMSRFEAERQAIALMDHPHIAKLLDAGAVGMSEPRTLVSGPAQPLTDVRGSDGAGSGRPFFVMELVKGIPLNEYCDQHKLSITERLHLFMQICSAVQHAHQKGIIHRDLKPSNILVESHDGKPVPKVIDFGLAKAMSGQPLTENTLFTALGTVAGTPLYMAPEQAAFNAIDVDTRADIYALGVILYELLTGSTPLERETLKRAAFDEILRVIRESEPPTPSKRLSFTESKPSVAANRQMEPLKLSRFLRGDLDWIVMKALAKERDRRYETARGFANDIERFLNHEPVLAGPPTASYRLRKFVKRNKGQVIAAGLVLSALVVGVIGTSIGLVRAEWARQAEVAQRERAEAGEKLAGERLVQVQAEKQKAEEEKRIAQAVRDFLQHKLLGQADSRTQADALLRAGGLAAEAKENPTIRELLDRAAKELAEDKIEANFPNQPLLQAEILATLGDTYFGVGEYERAIGFMERSARLFRQRLGADHADALAALNHLALAYEHAGKLNEAIALHVQVRDARVKMLGADHADTLATLANLASAYLAAGKLTEAIRLQEQVRYAFVKKLGADHPDTLITVNNLAEAYRAAGRLNEAIAMYVQVHDAQVEKLGADHPLTLKMLNNLAGASAAAGDLNNAIRLFEQVRDAQVKNLGADHPDTLRTLNNLAAAYWQSKQLDKSVPLFEDVLKRQAAKLGRQHPETQRTVGNLGVNYRDAGRLTEALPLLEEAYRASRKFQILRFAVAPLLDAYVKAGQSAEAVKLVQELLADARKDLPKDSPQLAGALAQYSRTLLQLKAYVDAEPLLRECLAIREKQEADAWTTFNTQSMLGGALLGQKKYADAEPFLLKGYEGMKERAAKIPKESKVRLTEALERLVQLYEVLDKKEEEAKWRKELESVTAGVKM